MLFRVGSGIFYQGIRHFFQGFWSINFEFEGKHALHSQLNKYNLIVIPYKHVTFNCDVITSCQSIFRCKMQSETAWLLLGLILDCFSLVRGEYNWVGTFRDKDIHVLRAESGQKITGHYGVGVPKTLLSGTLVASTYCKTKYQKLHPCLNKYFCYRYFLIYSLTLFLKCYEVLGYQL